ncbi:hypothetical protein [Vallitalea guaymasensis]|uniref:hypothetical protein n=1 Tax=Vallitalea guaymasensis TaxID=1185412 RepID=UPI00235475C8|nr:hypothetical protein [Vallitalea guaymasensis]
MGKLEELKPKSEVIQNDINETPIYIKDDLEVINEVEVLYKEEKLLKQEYNNYIHNKCNKALLDNNKYISLSNLSIELFNSLKSLSNIDLLFKYEDVTSRIQEIIEIEAYNIGHSDSL